MLYSTKKSRVINSFSEVSLPNPRDLFARYGERKSNSAIITTSREQVSTPIVSSAVPIRQLSMAQKVIESLDLPPDDFDTSNGIKKKSTAGIPIH